MRVGCLPLRGIVFGGLAEKRRVALLYALFYLLGILIDYDEGDAVCGELLGNLAAYAAEAAEDVVFVQLVDLVPHPLPFKVTPDGSLYRDLYG